MTKVWMMAALICAALLCGAPAAEAKSAKKAAPVEDISQVKAKLDSFVADYVERCNTSVNACRTKPSLAPRDGLIVATYIEIDPASVEVELFPAQSKHFTYMAQLRYVEHIYESTGKTEEEALQGVYKRVRTRRLTELPRYANGTWQN
ncbi:MAG: hypothetical protein J1E80_03560 [Desulfovibrionaceae bacterium]|nr:hypothetical protein [Desulfovibrionaceae bacterium]